MPFLATSLRSSAKFDAGPKRGDVGMDEFPDLVDLMRSAFYAPKRFSGQCGRREAAGQSCSRRRTKRRLTLIVSGSEAGRRV
jgi:hypothetical protein